MSGVQKDILLKNHTTFRIGGRAKYFFAARNREDLILAVRAAKRLKLPFFILGAGSNLLVSDRGYNGLVIKTQNLKFKTQIHNSKLKIFCEAGTPLAKLVKLSIEKGYSGLEWAAGIPGTVGGAICGNAGAFGKSMESIVKEIEAFDVKSGKVKVLKNKDCKFAYRDSIFRRNKNLIIISATVHLKRGNKGKIKNKTKEYLNYRKRNQPLNFPSAGSVFINAPGFSAGQLGEKDKSSSSAFAAARLIEKCGLKGRRIGRVKISEKHANFIVNLGQGKAKDVKKLINLIKQMVKRKFGIVLKEEIRFL